MVRYGMAVMVRYGNDHRAMDSTSIALQSRQADRNTTVFGST